MLMHDTLRQLQGGSVVATLAAAFQLAPAQAEAVMRTVSPEFAWHLERNTLSRGGLADLVEALGSGHHIDYLSPGADLETARARDDGIGILRHILGTKDMSRALAARAARQAGLSRERVEAMLPALAAVTMGGLAARAKGTLADVLGEVPPHGRMSSGNVYADLAGILRRGCGAGRYAPAALRRAARRGLARAGGFQGGGVLVWYARFMCARLAARAARTVIAR